MPPVAGGCSLAYGPVANVCNTAVPVVNMVPVTTVTPIPNTVLPQMAVGAPVSKGVVPWAAGAVPAPVPPVGSFAKGVGPFGKGMSKTSGVVPGLYTSEAGIVW